LSQYNSYYFNNARSALKYGLTQLSLSKQDYILLPEFICDVVILPLKQLSINYKFYPLDEHLEPNFLELESLVCENTKALMMVHYFGQPQKIKLFQDFCKEKKLLLIEDNAHGFGGQLNGQLLGTYGDIGISSPRKILNTIGGGVLWIKKDMTMPLPKLKNNPINIFSNLKKTLINFSPALSQKLKKLLIKRPLYEDPLTFKDENLGYYEIDKWSKSKIDNVNFKELLLHRQKVYKKWEKFAKNNGLKSVYKKLSKEAVPWCFAAYTKNQNESIKWFKWGWDKGINIYSWPTLPKELLNNENSSYKRWKKLICFDINNSR